MNTLAIAIPVAGILLLVIAFLVYFLTQWRKRDDLITPRNIIDEDNIPGQQNFQHYLQQNYEQDSTDVSHHNKNYEENSLDEQYLEEQDKIYSPVTTSDLNDQDSTAAGQNFVQDDEECFTGV